MVERVIGICEDPYELTTLSAALRLHQVNVVGEAHDLSTAEALFRSLNPEIAILSIHIDGRDVIQLAQKFRKINPKVGIVILSSCPDLRLLGIAEKEIPQGSQLILKNTVTDIEKIRTALVESLFISRVENEYTWVDSHNHEPHHAIISQLDDLTDGQIETLRLVASGHSNAEIGRIRFVTEKSVEQMISRIALQLHINPEKTQNLRVLLTIEYFKLLGSPRY